MSEGGIKGVHLLISGRVQGVGYRAWAKRAAENLALSGWVRNLPTGEVEAVVSGEATNVDAFISACWTGPGWAKVKDVKILSAAAPVESEGVEILRG